MADRQGASAPWLAGHAVQALTLADVQDWAAFALLPQMQQYTSTFVTEASELVPMIQRTQTGDANAPVLFGVREPAGGALVATFGFHTVSALNGTAELTYSVRPQDAGRGLATALCRAAVAWAFAERGWVRVQATVLEANLASRRVLDKGGFGFEGRLRNFRRVRGEPRDFLLFAKVPASSPEAGTPIRSAAR